MYVLPSTLFVAIITCVGLLLLVKSLTKLIAIYGTAPIVEFIAQSPAYYFDLPTPGIYEIAVKRPSVFGILPGNTTFEVLDRLADTCITVDNYRFRLAGRRDMLGNRIIPVAEFSIDQPSTFRLYNPANDDFTPNDKLLIKPKAGSKGILSILAVVFSSIIFVGGLSMCMVSLFKL